jgi:hypothetical protein
MSEIKNTVIDYALQNEQNLEIAYETYKAFDQISKNISKSFLFKLKERLENSLVGDSWIFPEINSAEKITFLIGNKNWTQETRFGLKDFNDNDRACFGVCTNEENRSKLFSIIQVDIQGRITPFGWWARLISPYNKWNESLDGLKSLYHPDRLLDYTEVNILKLANLVENYFKN